MTRRYPAVQRTEDFYLSPGVTFSKVQAATGTAEGFTTDEYTDEDGNEAVRARILVSTNNAKTARNATPVEAGFGYLRSQGDEFWLEGPEDIKAFQFVNNVSTEVVTLTVTMYYRAE